METKLQQQSPQNVQTSRANLTGIPTQMKLDFEQRSGLSFDDVRVHYNSDKPAQLQALAYTQGTQVYVGPGQERHLKHELGHVVQQKMGIVKPTAKLNGTSINDSPMLEKMADCWNGITKISTTYTGNMVAQRQSAFILTGDVTITEDEVVGAFYDTYLSKYEDPDILNILKKLVFKEVTSDMLEHELGPSHTYDEGQHIIYYSLNANDYTKIPDIKEDYEKQLQEKNSSFSWESFVKYAFLVTMVHEFGHAIQEEYLNIHRGEVGTALVEHHNVLFHENLYQGRKRGSYNPLNMVEMILNKDPFWKAGKKRPEQKESMIKLVNSETIDEAGLREIIDIIIEDLLGDKKTHNSFKHEQKVVIDKILTTLRQQSVLGKRESDYIKSLITSLMLDSQSYCWFNTTFDKIMRKMSQNTPTPNKEALK